MSSPERQGTASAHGRCTHGIGKQTSEAQKHSAVAVNEQSGTQLHCSAVGFSCGLQRDHQAQPSKLHPVELMRSPRGHACAHKHKNYQVKLSDGRVIATNMLSLAHVHVIRSTATEGCCAHAALTTIPNNQHACLHHCRILLPGLHATAHGHSGQLCACSNAGLCNTHPTPASPCTMSRCMLLPPCLPLLLPLILLQILLQYLLSVSVKVISTLPGGRAQRQSH
jgi:hypothetical protein